MPAVRLSLEPVAYTQRPGALSALAASPWAPLAALGGQHQIVLYQTQTLDVLGILPFEAGQPDVIRFSKNGALLIVFWNALLLHARWGGMVRERGLAVMSVFGNVVVSLSWFGVNMLGVGLHSYGFMDRAFGPLMTFIASQLVIVALGLLPLKHWRGIQARGGQASVERPRPLLVRSPAAKPG